MEHQDRVGWAQKSLHGQATFGWLFSEYIRAMNKFNSAPIGICLANASFNNYPMCWTHVHCYISMRFMELL